MVLLAACGRVDFEPLSPPDGTASADSALPDGASDPDSTLGTLTVRQREIAYGFTEITVAPPQEVRPGNALVAIALSQQQPILTLADDLGNTWTGHGEAISPITGSKVLAWVACDALGGANTVRVTPSFDNGPVHLAVVEIDGASTACVDQAGEHVVTASETVQNVATDGPLASDGQIVIAAFGAWFDEVAYTAQDGDTITVSARPTPPAPMGDTLALVTSTRGAGPQSVTVTADHATLYAALVLSIR
jgi:hypothetical protein